MTSRQEVTHAPASKYHLFTPNDTDISHKLNVIICQHIGQPWKKHWGGENHGFGTMSNGGLETLPKSFGVMALWSPYCTPMCQHKATSEAESDVFIKIPDSMV